MNNITIQYIQKHDSFYDDRVLYCSVHFNEGWLMQFYITRNISDEKENNIFLIYKEIQVGSGAKSYMRKGFLIYEEMHKYVHHI